MLILKIGLVPDRHGTRNSLRQSALDPGFHDVPPGPARADGDANGVGDLSPVFGNEPPGPGPLAKRQ